jgi:hypothetical protein
MTRQSRLFVSGFFALTSIVWVLRGQAADEKQPAVTSKSAGSKPTDSAAPTKPAPSAPGNTNAWTSMFDGKTLRGWKETDFAGRGEVKVQDGKLVLESGYMTGVTWTGDVPRMNYEVELQAMRVDGSDFFCGLTFPVGPDPCSLIVGGWGGGVVGLSSLDGQDAANNETAQYLSFEKGRWYKIRLRVLPDKIQAWIDDEKIVDAVTTDRKISIRPEVELSLPFGFSTWSTTGALRNIRIRKD